MPENTTLAKYHESPADLTITMQAVRVPFESVARKATSLARTDCGAVNHYDAGNRCGQQPTQFGVSVAVLADLSLTSPRKFVTKKFFFYQTTKKSVI